MCSPDDALVGSRDGREAALDELLATVDDEGLSGDVAGLVSGEKECSAHDVFGLARALDGAAVNPVSLRVFHEAEARLGQREARGDRVHRDTLRTHLGPSPG